MPATHGDIKAHPLTASDIAEMAEAEVTALLSAKAHESAAFKINPGQQQSLLLADISSTGVNRIPFTLGIVNYLLRHLPSVGFFVPVAGKSYPNSSLPDRHVELVVKVFNFKDDPSKMVGFTEQEAAKMLAGGKTSEFLEKLYNSYQQYAQLKEFCFVEGPGAVMGGNELDAQLASTLSAPVLLTLHGQQGWQASDYYNLAMVKAEMFRRHKVDVLGVALTKVVGPKPQAIVEELSEKFAAAGLGFVGGLPEDHMLAAVRLDDVITKLDAKVLFGHGFLDQEFGRVVVGTQRVEELLEVLEDCSDRPLLVTSMDRLDIVLAMSAAQASVNFPSIAAILLTNAAHSRPLNVSSEDSVSRIYRGIEEGNQFHGHLMPILSVEKPLFEVVHSLGETKALILPSSLQKIQRSKDLFDQCIDAKVIKDWLDTHPRDPCRMTPKMFQYNIKTKCLATPQRIVLPESNDKRVLAAAAEVTQRGLAHVILLGDPVVVQADAHKLGLDISKCDIVNPQVTGDELEKYLNAFLASRGSKAPPRQSAIDQILGDVNLFGVLMVHLDEADGMVSGALHTTAATVRPAMQVLKGGGRKLVSSIFFMCLPDKVLTYGDCAVNPNPSAQDLADIAITSAETAKAFGLEPRVAMLSYSTLTSGSGPDVQKVTEAVSILKKTLEPEVAPYFCGPLQYDAAIDPVVAEVKVKRDSKVAGKATVLIFPDLNTGNNTYKAVQQATGAIAVGPIMQGLSKPVNDLSRGCTVDDIVNTICVTSVQAMQAQKS